MRTVTKIPATINKMTAAPIGSGAKRKVAAYARVSTDQDEQLNSYEAQVDYYTNYINSREDWEFVKCYADAGVTGTSTRARSGFNSMIEDALAGKINLIVTKSVSRFARNTVDSLTTIRKLKENGVEIWFEKENIFTFDSKGEIMLTILSSLSQEESRSISENVIWGMRKSFADGKYSVGFAHFLGYDRGENGEWVVNEEQAKTVKRIYALYLQGRSTSMIAKMLTEEGVKTPGGKDKWHRSSVLAILKNEKYCGNALLQKGYIEDFLTKKYRKNNGEVPQYFVEGGHPAIVEPAVYEMVQRRIELQNQDMGRRMSTGIFSGMIKCGDCGCWYGSKVWHSNDKYRKVVWQCGHKYADGKKCTTPKLDELDIQQLFIRAANKAVKDKEAMRKKYEEAIDKAFDTAELEERREKLKREAGEAGDLVEACIKRNARIAQNQEEYRREYDALAERYTEAKDRLDAVCDQIKEKIARREQVERFLKDLERREELFTEFDENAWFSLVDYVTVNGKDDMVVTFKDGTEVRA